MKKMLKKVRDAENGFTLVELIVVLVILAILAAFTVPALTGYIDRARDESLISETRMAIVATQTVVSTAYATDMEFSTEEYTVENVRSLIAETAGSLEDGFTAANIQEIELDGTGKISSLQYKSGSTIVSYNPKAADGQVYTISTSSSNTENPS